MGRDAELECVRLMIKDIAYHFHTWFTAGCWYIMQNRRFPLRGFSYRVLLEHETAQKTQLLSDDFSFSFEDDLHQAQILSKTSVPASQNSLTAAHGG